MNLYRLIDEATKTVEGYEKAAKMTAVTSDKEIKQLMGWLHSYDGDDWFVPSSFTRIPHTRKDMYTGVDVDGVKVFENSTAKFNKSGAFAHYGYAEWLLKIEMRYCQWVAVAYKDGEEVKDYRYMPYSPHRLYFLTQLIEITGIEGVT